MSSDLLLMEGARLSTQTHSLRSKFQGLPQLPRRQLTSQPALTGAKLGSLAAEPLRRGWSPCVGRAAEENSMPQSVGTSASATVEHRAGMQTQELQIGDSHLHQVKPACADELKTCQTVLSGYAVPVRWPL